MPVGPDKRPYTDVLPIGDDGDRHWEQWTRRLPAEDEVNYWYRRAPNAGVGLIMGRISGGAQALDVDDGLFSQFVQTIPIIRERCWGNLTGSGKVHLIVRSAPFQEPPEHILRDPRVPRKLADIRGEGAYVVAPPSIYGRTGGRYSIWCGSPEDCPSVADPYGLWLRLADLYAQGHPAPSSGANGTVQERHELKVLPPLSGAQFEAMLGRIQEMPSIRTRREILQPEDVADDSARDHAICKELLSMGWKPADIEIIYATFPIGLPTYQNTRRPNHGRRYLLDYTIPAAQKALDAEREQARLATGENFRLLRAYKMHYEPPLYKLVVEFTDDPPEVKETTMTIEELFSERLFKRACFRDMDRIIKLQGGHKGSGFDAFLDVVRKIETHLYPPPGATEAGQLRGMLLAVLKDRLDRNARPSTPAEVRFGWIDQHDGVAYVSGHALMAHFRQTQRHPPSPTKVWDALEGMGAHSRRYRIGTRSEEFWAIPLQALD